MRGEHTEISAMFPRFGDTYTYTIRCTPLECLYEGSKGKTQECKKIANSMSNEYKKDLDCRWAVSTSYDPGAAKECEMILNYLGINYCRVDGKRGSHTADIYFSDKYIPLFQNEIKGRMIRGKYRSFYFGEGVLFSVRHFYVSYRPLK